MENYPLKTRIFIFPLLAFAMLFSFCRKEKKAPSPIPTSDFRSAYTGNFFIAEKDSNWDFHYGGGGSGTTYYLNTAISYAMKDSFIDYYSNIYPAITLTGITQTGNDTMVFKFGVDAKGNLFYVYPVGSGSFINNDSLYYLSDMSNGIEGQLNQFAGKRVK